MASKCYWITGLSATGKTTYSNLLVNHFRTAGKQVIQLDGDELRQVFAAVSSSPKIGHSISRKWHDPLHTGECHEKKQAQ